MNWLNYHHLYYFWTIAKEGGVTAACKKLRLSQPTLSGQLKQFEEALGKPLFERKSRKLILNETGRLVFDHADSIFKMGDQLINAVQNESVKERVLFHIGVLPSLPKKDIYDFIKIALSHSHVQLSLKVASVDELLVELLNHNIDAIISHAKAPLDLKGIYSYHLDKVPIIIVGSRDFKGLRRGFPKSIEGKPIFLPSYKSYLRNEIDEYFKKNDVQPNIRGEVQDTEFLRVLAAAGEGLVTIERTAVSDLLKSKDLVTIGDNLGIWEDYYLIVSEKSSEHPMVEKIRKKYN